MKKIIKWIIEPSVTSFGDNVYRQRWHSSVCDILCVLTFGLYKPRRQKGETCFGDLNSPY